MNLLGDLYSDAELSTDGVYRYRLRRAVGSERLDGPRATTLLWVMLNPSTADARDDDPTIRRVVSFTRREGFTQLEVVNLFAFRAAEPEDLWRAYAEARDVVGPLNDAIIAAGIAAADSVVLAWGAAPASRLRRARWDRRVDAVTARIVDLRPEQGRFRCLGTSRDGHPRHPLFVRSACPLVPWSPA